jgi:hypothetical protein
VTAIEHLTVSEPHNQRRIDSQATPSPGVTPRVVILCLALAVFFGYIIPIIDVKLQNSYLGAQNLPPGAIGALLVLLLVVQPLLKFLGRSGRVRPFARNELLTVYIACLFATIVPGHGAENFFVPNLIGVFYYASPENRWLEIWGTLKDWMTPSLSGGKYHREVAQGWYQGIRPEQSIPWELWLVPLVAWSALVFAIYIMLCCVSVMLRAQWGEREALAFPLLRLPLEMTEDVDTRKGSIGSLFRNPTMWIGFGIAVFIQTMRSLHVYFPDVPDFPLQLTENYFTEPPWNQIDRVDFVVYPIAVGISFLLTAEVSFSLWFFYWFIKFQYLIAYYLGFMPNAMPAAIGSQGRIFTGFQHVGAYFAYVGLALWTARFHLAHIARRAFGRARPSENEAREVLSYPTAFWGFVLSFAFIIGWSIVAGVAPSLAIAMWVCYLVIAIALTRIVAEAGLLLLEHGWQPVGMFAQFFNAGPGHWISPQNGVVPAHLMQTVFMVDVRGFSMPSFMQSFKLAYDQQIAPRPLMRLIVAIILISLAMSIIMNVQLGYRGGGGLMFQGWFSQIGPRTPAWWYDGIKDGVQNASPLHFFWFLLGGVVTFGILWARSRLPMFPIHPVGYLVCLTSTIHSVWLSVFIGWTCKVLITKFMGTDAYRKATPVFLGLALGDVASILFWLVIDAWQGRTTHTLTSG